MVSSLPPEAAILLTAMLPVAELRLALPLALEVYNMPIWKAVFLSVVGNMMPTTAILLVVPKLHDWILSRPWMGRAFSHFLRRAEEKFSGSYAKYGAIALVIFVGIPLPMTGAWTGALAAFVFNLPFRKSWPLIFSGVCLAAIIVLLLTKSTVGVIGWLK